MVSEALIFHVLDLENPSIKKRMWKVKCTSEKPREASSLTLLCFWKVKARRDLRGGGNEGIKKLRNAAGV